MLGFTSFLSLLALLSLTTSTIAANISIIVANQSSPDVAQHFFFPNNITANVGDIVTFEFHGTNDSVTQSTSVNDPCHKKDGGIDSGLFQVASNETVFPRFSFTVNSTDPLFFFDAGGGFFNKCKDGFVFGINVPQDIFLKFRGAAILADIPLFNGVQSSSIAAPTTTDTLSTKMSTSITPLSTASQLSAPTAGSVGLGASSNGAMNVGVTAIGIIGVVVSIFINL